MMLPEVKALIEHFKFERLPVESTLYVSTYRSDALLPEGGHYGTAIIAMYCDEPRSVSLFHKLTVDEVWHFYAGDPMRLILLYPDGSSRDVILGNNPLAGQQVQFVVPAGVWQAGHMLAGGRYSLFGCTMAPGFSSAMFIGGAKAELLARYPNRAADIALFGLEDGKERYIPEGYG